MIRTQNAKDAVKAHGTVFFTSNLAPVTPRIGQWFCEFDLREDDNSTLQDEDLVEYCGPDDSMTFGDHGAIIPAEPNPARRHLVRPDGWDCARRVSGLVLILQA